MSRITLACCFAALLGSCTSLSANRIDWEHARLACADVGIDPVIEQRIDQHLGELARALTRRDEILAVLR